MKPDFKQGVLDALKPISYEEAIACGFAEPYSTVIKETPMDKLFALRRKRLLGEK